jgi:hypothetical protein
MTYGGARPAFGNGHSDAPATRARLKSGAESSLHMAYHLRAEIFALPAPNAPAAAGPNALTLPDRLRQMLDAIFFAVAGHAKL